MTTIPTGPDTWLRRKQTAAALTIAGYPTAETTLATRASRGGGPLYRMYGNRTLYRWGDALAWAEGRLSAPRRASPKAGAQRNTSA